jgi:DNA polymerase IV
MSPMAERCVAHLDMDAFYVSVELRRRPELRGLPVIVAGNGPRSVVTTASYEARRFGVGSAIPAARARALCRDGVFLTPDFPAYRAASTEVMAIVRSQVAVVEVVGLDEVYLDLTGLPAPRACMRRLQRAIELETRLTCSVGIGPNKLIAKIASDMEKPHGFVVLDAPSAAAAVAGSAPDRIPGIGPKSADRLRAAGIATVAELAACDEHELAKRLGRPAGGLLRLARLELDGEVTQERKVISESRELTFDADIADAGELERVLARLTAELCEELERRGRCGRTVSIKVRLDDFRTFTRARTLPEPVNSLARVLPVALELLRGSWSGRPVRLLGVRIAGLHAAAEERRQLSLAL